MLLYDNIKTCSQEKSTKWKDINSKSALGDIIVVFDNNKSSNTRFIREKFELKNNFPSNCFAVKSNPEVISYVEKNKNAIGIISVNWISDKNDSVSHQFLKNDKVVSVGRSEILMAQEIITDLIVVILPKVLIRLREKYI